MSTFAHQQRSERHAAALWLCGIVSAFVAGAAAADIDFTILPDPVFSHTEWNGTAPAQSWQTTDDPNDGAYYSLRGLAYDPASQLLYTAWMHAHGSRWVFSHSLANPGPSVTVSDPIDAAHLFSNSTSLQTTPKALAVDSLGRVYASIMQGGHTNVSSNPRNPIPLSDVIRYNAGLDAAVHTPGNPNPFTGVFDTPYASGPPTYDTSSPNVFDVNADTAGGNPEGIAIAGDDLYVVLRNQGKVARYSVSTGALLDTFTLAGSSDLRGVTVGQDGNVYVADRGGQAVYRINPGTGTITKGPDLGLKAHHLTTTIINGVEVLVGTGKFEIFLTPAAGFGNLLNYTISPESFVFDGRGGFGQIVAIGNLLLWTHEDAEQVNGLDRNFILGATIDPGQTIVLVPEPTTAALLVPLAALACFRRRRVA